MFGQDRQQLRQKFFDVWHQMQQGSPLIGLDKMLAQVISQHPEYHAIFNRPELIDQEFFVEAGQTNPYLHMSLHISLHEQVSTDRPAGIKAIYQQLLAQSDNAHDCDHLMMDCLAETLWSAQRSGIQPSEQDYLNRLRSLLNRPTSS